MTKMEIKKILDQEIEKACRSKAIDFSTLDIDGNLNLLGSGIFDSLGILQLISRMEEKVGGDVDLSEYSPSEFTDYHQLIMIFEDISENKDKVQVKI